MSKRRDLLYVGGYLDVNRQTSVGVDRLSQAQFSIHYSHGLSSVDSDPSQPSGTREK